MKKILLIIAIVFCIFQMVVLGAEIIIGEEAIDRPNGWGVDSDYTCINAGATADADGTITEVQFYLLEDSWDVEVATFFNVSGNNWSTRDDHFIGHIGGGYHSYEVELDVEIGDCIGIAFRAGGIERDAAGYDGMYYTATNYDIPCTNKTFVFLEGDCVSLKGIGATVEVGIKWNGITITKWNGIEITIPLNTQ